MRESSRGARGQHPIGEGLDPVTINQLPGEAFKPIPAPARVEVASKVVPRLFVTGGIRYTHEKRSFDQIVNGVALFPQTAEKSFNRVTYKGTVRFEIGPDTNIYATYSTGFKSGVFNMTGVSPLAVDPETLKALEGGIKSDITPWLRANLALYRYDYKDLQVTARDPLGPGYVLQNAANATARLSLHRPGLRPQSGESREATYAGGTHGACRRTRPG